MSQRQRPALPLICPRVAVVYLAVSGQGGAAPATSPPPQSGPPLAGGLRYGMKKQLGNGCQLTRPRLL